MVPSLPYIIWMMDSIDEYDDDHDEPTSSDEESEYSESEYSDESTGDEEPSSKRKRKEVSINMQRVSVTLGLDFNMDVVAADYKVLMDSASEKTKGLLNDWKPSVPFQWLACRFSRPTKRNFFHDSWDIVKVTAEELGYTVLQFLDFRGWAFHRDRKSQAPHLRYHRFQKCVERSKLDNKTTLIHHFNDMLASLWTILKDAYEKFPSSQIRNFERDYSTKESFRAKINGHVQVYHLCYAITIIVFGKAANTLKMEIELLVFSIFGNLTTRPKIVHALNNLLRVFPSDLSIQKSQPDIVNWLQHPSLILRKIMSMIPPQPETEYQKLVSESVNNELPERKHGFVAVRPNDRPRAYPKNVAVVRLQVLHLSSQAKRSYEKGKHQSRPKKSPTTVKAPTQNKNDSFQDTQDVEDSLQEGSSNKDGSDAKTNVQVHSTDELPKDDCFDSLPMLMPATEPRQDELDSCDVVEREEEEHMESNSPIDPPNPVPFVNQCSEPMVRPRCSEAEVLSSQAELSILPRLLLASRSVMNNFSCVLVSDRVSDGTELERMVCQLSSHEVYFHADLKTIDHRVSYVQDEPTLLSFLPGSALRWIPLSVSIASFEFSILRCDHTLFKKHFDGLKCDHLAILDFLVKSGISDGSRDGEGPAVGLRHDFGVGNQSYNIDRNKDDGTFFDRPNCDCGLEAIRTHPKAEVILCSLGNVADALQLAFDELMKDYLRQPRQQDDDFRNQFFSSELAAHLKCLYSRLECGTILGKCLSFGQYCKIHMDTLNCDKPGYRHTFNYSLVVKVDKNMYWRICYLFNLRQAAGDYINRENGIQGFLVKVDLYLQEITTSYQQLLDNTGINTDGVPISWRACDELFLCDQSPWVEYVLPNSTIIHIMKPRAGISRDYWFSMAADVLRRAKCLVLDDIFELLLIALYQSSWVYFYITVKTMIEDGSGHLSVPNKPPGTVAALYCQTCCTLFGGSFHCGVLKRFQISNIDFPLVYLNNAGVTEAFTAAMASLVDLRDWAEMAMDCESTDLKEKLQAIVPSLPFIAEFRLQMFLPLCGLSGLLVHNLGIVDVAYPCVGKGSHQTLTELHLKEGRVDQFMSLMSQHLQIVPHRSSLIEGILCEMKDSRRDVCDIMIKGQSLSEVRVNVVNKKKVYQLRVKQYGEREWRVYN
jgi:hypothetical protein